MNRKTYLQYLSLAILIMLAGKFLFLNNGLAWLIHGIKPIFYVLIIVYLMAPMVDFIDDHTKFNRTGSVIASFIIVVIVLAGFVGLIVPSIADSIVTIKQSTPKSNEQLLETLEGIPFLNYFIDTSSLQSLLDNLSSYILSIGDYLVGYSSEIITSVKNVITTISILLLSAIMAFHALRTNDHIGQTLEEILRAFLPKVVADHFFKFVRLMDDAMRKFLIGKLYTCFILGGIVTLLIVLVNIIGPFGIKIPYAPLIGFIIGITNIIPYVGPLIGTIPCVILALLAGFGEAVALLIVVIGAQQIDNILVSPKILGSSVGLSAFWVIMAVSVGGSLFGAIGMVLFVPITAVVLKLVTEQVEKYKQSKTT